MPCSRRRLTITALAGQSTTDTRPSRPLPCRLPHADNCLHTQHRRSLQRHSFVLRHPLRRDELPHWSSHFVRPCGHLRRRPDHRGGRQTSLRQLLVRAQPEERERLLLAAGLYATGANLGNVPVLTPPPTYYARASRPVSTPST
ncbi:MAG: hypothetical protein M0C28_35110 [Candidatus Moduliflexus flocculans]|nr:hypothetical protein [Candidatus Moduliflexus flocculans]